MDESWHNWTPPDGLDRARPREVRLKPAGVALLLIAALLAAGGVAAGIALTLTADRQAERQRLLLAAGVDTEGVITRLWRAPDKERQPRVAYQFTAGGRTYQGQSPAKLRLWKTLETGSPLAVRFLPSRPDVNHPRDWQDRPMPFWLPYLVGGALLAMAALPTLPVRTQRRLLSEGRAAPGIVTRHARGQHGTTVHYNFRLLSGATAKGHCGPVKKPAPVGSSVCVLYDPENPRRTAVYPMLLVTVPAPSAP